LTIRLMSRFICRVSTSNLATTSLIALSSPNGGQA
jgi:hypothetical protein